MFDRREIRLALYNVAVFAIVLIVFSTIIYTTVVSGLYADLRSHMTQLVDGVVASIDYDEDKKMLPESAEPDLIVSILPESLSASLSSIRLQWFNNKGELALEKGRFKSVLPLKRDGGFEWQDNPRGLVLTKPVIVKNQLLGFARVVQPLDQLDKTVLRLQLGFALGVLVAIAVSGVGIVFLIRQSMHPLNENLKQLRQFTADASHELRSPVTAITSNSRVALKYPDGMRESDKEKFEFILAASNQMARLVEDLLKLDTASAASPVSFSDVHNLNEILEEVRSLLDWSAKEKEIKLAWKVDKDLYVRGSAEDLQLLFRNLLENAIRYTSNDGNVTLAAHAERDQIKVIVEDNGIGISKSDLPKIYDRFWRADKARSHFDSGNGLGLSIVMSVLKRLNGTIAVQSEITKGTKFTVHIPRQKQNSV
jgi:signal transduction histidine kinase